MVPPTPAIRQQPPQLGGMAPVAVAAALQHLPGLVFFDSAGNLESSAQQPVSVIAARPEPIFRGSIHSASDRDSLRAALATHPAPTTAAGQRASALPLGGLCGWIDYEGRFVFGNYRDMLVYDHARDIWWETGNLSEMLRPAEPPTDFAIGRFRPATSRAAFIRAVERAQEWIRSGDIYQANLSHAFRATVRGGSLFSLYQSLRAASPAPMAAWLALDGYEILSSSPETFLKIAGREIETRPIKGTRPRASHPDADRRAAAELQSSAKETAELVMITDLLRNDLGQVCNFGSVHVAAMLQLESFAQVHHLVSTVRGTLRPTADAIDAVAACFPGGSITGAPKKRAMEIIRELEPAPRGIYCGAIGWFGANGHSSFNIAIRTLVRHQSRLIYQVGAGIVADSNPAAEYRETLAKAAGIRHAIAQH